MRTKVGARFFVLLVVVLSATPVRAQTIDEFFDDTVVHDIHLLLQSNDWAALKLKFTENIYYATELRWRGMTVKGAGVRSRGFGSRSGTKPGLRVDIDRYAIDQTFLGMKSFVLDNLVQDPSMLRERLSMAFFRRLGLPAPREAHARLFVNDQFVGVYAVVETIDKGFLGRSFGADTEGGVENDGYLYEYDYTRDYKFEYLGENLDEYKMFSPKTNEKHAGASIWGPIENMIQAINEAPDPLFVSDVSQYLDLNVFAKHLGIENFLGEDDGIVGYAGLNNFYMYRFERSNKFQFLAWDKDNTFHSVDFNIMNRVNDNVLSRRALAINQYRNIYLDTLLAAATLALEPDPAAPEFDENGQPVARPGWLEREVIRQHNQIQALAHLDTFKPHSNEEFEASFQHLLNFARQRAAFVRAEVELLRPSGGQ